MPRIGVYVFKGFSYFFSKSTAIVSSESHINSGKAAASPTALATSSGISSMWDREVDAMIGFNGLGLADMWKRRVKRDASSRILEYALPIPGKSPKFLPFEFTSIPILDLYDTWAKS